VVEERWVGGVTAKSRLPSITCALLTGLVACTCRKEIRLPTSVSLQFVVRIFGALEPRLVT